MPTVAKIALPLAGVLALVAILVVALGSAPGEVSGTDELSTASTAVPAIDAGAPAETKTATFALG